GIDGYASPKITLRFTDMTSHYPHSDNQLYQNPQDIKYQLCGVKRTECIIPSALTVRSDFEGSVDHHLTDDIEIVCKTCKICEAN
ncbi:4124_t:CDS:2, partial [Gigaspora margarita]